MSDEPARFGPVDVLQIASKLTIDDAFRHEEGGRELGEGLGGKVYLQTI